MTGFVSSSPVAAPRSSRLRKFVVGGFAAGALILAIWAVVKSDSLPGSGAAGSKSTQYSDPNSPHGQLGPEGKAPKETTKLFHRFVISDEGEGVPGASRFAIVQGESILFGTTDEKGNGEFAASAINTQSGIRFFACCDAIDGCLRLVDEEIADFSVWPPDEKRKFCFSRLSTVDIDLVDSARLPIANEPVLVARTWFDSRDRAAREVFTKFRASFRSEVRRTDANGRIQLTHLHQSVGLSFSAGESAPSSKVGRAWRIQSDLTNVIPGILWRAATPGHYGVSLQKLKRESVLVEVKKVDGTPVKGATVAFGIERPWQHGSEIEFQDVATTDLAGESTFSLARAGTDTPDSFEGRAYRLAVFYKDLGMWTQEGRVPATGVLSVSAPSDFEKTRTRVRFVDSATGESLPGLRFRVSCDWFASEDLAILETDMEGWIDLQVSHGADSSGAGAGASSPSLSVKLVKRAGFEPNQEGVFRDLQVREGEQKTVSLIRTSR